MMANLDNPRISESKYGLTFVTVESHHALQRAETKYSLR